MNIALIGYGKMGKAIEEIAVGKGHKIVLKIDADNLADLNKSNLNKADVAIEFTQPESAFENIRKCIEYGTPVVSGTTGWTERLDEIKNLCLLHETQVLQRRVFSLLNVRINHFARVAN